MSGPANQEDNFIGDFDNKFQQAIVGHMMRDRGFRMMIFSHNIRAEHFRDPYIGKAAEYIRKIADTEAGAQTLGPAELYQLACHEYVNEGDRNKFKAATADCAESAVDLKVEVVSQKMTGWIRLLRLKQMILESTAMINKKDFGQALSYVETVVRQINQIDFTPENKTLVKFENTIDFILHQDRNRFANNCTTGSPVFDELLLEGAAFGIGSEKGVREADKAEWNKKLDEALAAYKHKLKYQGVKSEVLDGINIPPMARSTRGSLMPGDATILLGPANSGKTTIIVTLVAQNILMGKDVLLIVHEQHSDDIKAKILQAMFFMDPQAMTAMAKNNPDAILDYERLINRRLTYIHYIRAGHMTVEAVGGLIEQAQDKRKAQYGKGYDLMVDDYPGKLSARSLEHRNSVKKHEEIAFVYDYLINLGREHKFHSFLAMQTNREGYKVAQASDASSRVVDIGDAGESFNPMQLADNVITINRGDEDKLNKRIRLYVGKSRKSQTGYMFVSKTDMARSRAYGEGFTEEIRSNGEVIRHSLPCFIMESKAPKENFNQQCALVFGEQQRSAKEAAEKALANATMKATEPSQKEALALAELQKETKLT